MSDNVPGRVTQETGPWQYLVLVRHFCHFWQDINGRIITAMAYLYAGIVLVAAIAAPYLVEVALNAAFPGLRRWTAGMPRTDEVVERFFYRTIPRADRADDVGVVSERSRLDGTSRR